jgi:hypothetical protein
VWCACVSVELAATSTSDLEMQNVAKREHVTYVERPEFVGVNLSPPLHENIPSKRLELCKDRVGGADTGNVSVCAKV